MYETNVYQKLERELNIMFFLEQFWCNRFNTELPKPTKINKVQQSKKMSKSSGQRLESLENREKN